MNRVLVVRTVAGRRIVSTGAPWEPVVGYSRAVRAGNWIAVTGTIGLRPDGTCPAEASEQMRQALQIVVAAVEALGGKRSDIIRTRMFLTDIKRWEEIGRIHSEILGDVMPATTMIQISALAHPDAVVEVEADAVVMQPEQASSVTG